jgi:hypothetical protein
VRHGGAKNNKESRVQHQGPVIGGQG